MDDQSYQEIVEKAKARLPRLCPGWTDHNAHDPGITVLELMAWYKELQQFHMDQTTDALRRQMLSLAGCEPLRQQSAECVIEPLPEDPGRPAFSRLSSAQGVEFEMAEPIPARRTALAVMAAESCDTRRRVDIGSVISGNLTFRPFRFGGGAKTELCLGFSPKPEGELRLWFEVPPPHGAERNPPAEDSVPPRQLIWEAEGCGALQPVLDETWSLSWSGYVVLPVPEAWQPGENGLYWLRLREEEAGCEGEARLAGVYTGRYRCVQQRTRASSSRFHVGSAPEQTVTLPDTQNRDASVRVFLRRPEGWQRVADWREETAADGTRRITLDGSGSAQDGADNLLVVRSDPAYALRLFFESGGLPEESFYLDLDEQYAMRLTLICPTLEPDGIVRPDFWRPVEDLSACSPRDRVFELDHARSIVRFGDGAHGSVPAPGEIVVSELVLSRCGGGNVPRDAGLRFDSDGMPAGNAPALGGRDPETTAEAGIRLRRALADTSKCVTSEDYERCARRTPGLRVACARALPGYNAAGGRRQDACVSVVVLPESEAEQPMPDRRFLDAVNRQLERCRNVCIHASAIPPRYVSIAVSAQLVVSAEADEAELRGIVQRSFRPCAELVGRTLRRGDLSARLQKLPGVLQVRRIELRGRDQNSYQTAAGDLDLPPNGIPRLDRLELILTDQLSR